MRTGLTLPTPASKISAPLSGTESFRLRFQRSLRCCVRRQFSVAECFGLIWLETLEEVPLSEDEQAELYEELIDWAKYKLRM